MELEKAILERRSVRHYEERPIPDETIRELLETAVWAPSGTNMQPWYFAAVRSPEACERLLSLMRQVKRDFEPVLQTRFPGHPEVRRETLTFIESLGGAPVVVLVFLLKDYAPEWRFAAEQSVSAAIQNLCLAAHGKGLATCWLTSVLLAHSVLEAEFGSGKGSFMGMVTLGYAGSTPTPPPRKDGRYELL